MVDAKGKKKLKHFLSRAINEDGVVISLHAVEDLRLVLLTLDIKYEGSLLGNPGIIDFVQNLIKE